MRKIGWGWIEDWQGYQEIRFPTQHVESLRLIVRRRWVMADELEIFEAGSTRRNVALEKTGTRLVENSATFRKASRQKNLSTVCSEPSSGCQVVAGQ